MSASILAAVPAAPTVTEQARTRSSEPTGRRRVTAVLSRPGWPLATILVPYPIWWVMGLTELIVLAMAIPMLAHLLRQPTIRVPRGFGWWMLFLLWVLAGAFLLQVDAFGAVADDSSTRLLTFGYRFLQYLAITVVLLYVINRIADLTATRVVRMVACLCLTITAGGLLGVFAPYFEFSSLVELILPRSISDTPFVQTLVHPSAAQLQGVLGYEAPRPSAPFTFTNTWGLNFALTLPFFLLAWTGREAGWRRWWAGPILLAASVPVIYSLNRGLWGALVAMALFVAVRAALTRRPGLLVAIVAGFAVFAMVLVVSPLGTIDALRFSNDGSEEGRANLGSLAVESVAKTSPLVGLGSTRNVQGNFNSISGGATAQCPRCSPPSLGTQGQLWLVVFSQGVVGLLFFVLFFSLIFLRHLRVRSPVATMGLSVMVGWLLTFPVYNSLGMGMLIVMVAVGLLCRERGGGGDNPSRTAAAPLATPNTLGQYVIALRSGSAAVLALALVGLVVGATWSVLRPSPYNASATILLPDSLINVSATYPPTSLDTEAQLVASAKVRRAAARASQQSEAAVAEDLSVTATPNTRVLQVRFSAPGEVSARAGAESAAQAVLEMRSEALEEERRAALLPLRAREAALISGADTLTRTIQVERRDLGAGPNDRRTVLQRELRNALINQSLQVQSEMARLSSLVLEGGRVTVAAGAKRSGDGFRVNAVSGTTTGAGLGAAMVVLLGPRLRRIKDFEDATGVPLLGRAEGSQGGADAVAQMLAGRSVAYLPADDTDPRAVGLADRLTSDSRLMPDVARPVAVVVATKDTRTQHVRRAVDRFRRQGLDARGLVVAEDPRPAREED